MSSVPWGNEKERADWYKNLSLSLQKELQHYKDLEEQGRLIEQKHGHWILKHVGAGHYWECSVCHTNTSIYVTKDTNYCPHCGAKMDEVE